MCPGYARSFRFISENAHLRHLYASKKYSFDTDHDVLMGRSLQDYLVIFPTICRPPGSSSSAHLQSMLGYILSDPHCTVVLSEQVVWTFLRFVPCRIGVNEALDAAVCCLCYAYMDFLSVERVSSKTLSARGRSLKILQAYITDEAFQKTSETICASVIIQYCEVCCYRTYGHRKTCIDRMI